MLYIEADAEKYANAQRATSPYYIKLIECVKFQCEAGYSWRVTPMEYHTVFLLTKGTLCDQRTGDTVEKNEPVFVPKFSRMRFSVERSAELVQAVFDSSLALNFLKVYGHWPSANTAKIAEKLEELYHLSHSQSTVPCLSEAILLEILYGIERAAASVYEPPLCRRAVEWIEENAYRAISAEDVSAAMGVTRAYLGRVLKAARGKSLGELIAGIRLEKIKQLCRMENLTFSDIAGKCDFYSEELLRKFFKYHTGESISAYRRSLNL